MGFWHTGYAEFHEPSGLEGFACSPPPPVRYVCEHCSESFEELDALRRHRFEKHPLRQPALLLRGRAVGGLPVVLLSALRPEDVVVEDVSCCKVGGHTISPTELGTFLASMSREFVDVELVNQDTVTRCLLDFRIADEQHLAGVESAFLRMARDRALSLDAVARFIQDCRAFSSAIPYCDGICHYLYGVMAKEKAPDSGLQPGQYIERYLRASDELSGFERPLARSVRALVAFHFNQFEEAEWLAPEGALRHTAGGYASLLQGLPWHLEGACSPTTGDTVEDLLTDQETLQILADARFGLLELKDRTEALQSRLRLVTSGYDRLKLLLLACEALATTDETASRAAARRLVREVASQSELRTWAEGMMKKLEPR